MQRWLIEVFFDWIQQSVLSCRLALVARASGSGLLESLYNIWKFRKNATEIVIWIEMANFRLDIYVAS